MRATEDLSHRLEQGRHAHVGSLLDGRFEGRKKRRRPAALCQAVAIPQRVDHAGRHQLIHVGQGGGPGNATDQCVALLDVPTIGWRQRKRLSQRPGAVRQSVHTLRHRVGKAVRQVRRIDRRWQGPNALGVARHTPGHQVMGQLHQVTRVTHAGLVQPSSYELQMRRRAKHGPQHRLAFRSGERRQLDRLAVLQQHPQAGRHRA